ncbi:hypothetical protein F2Q69_00059493 [Brassica cretica]|uniref:Uncharacterized protein n=1 Tax=Brassica cretica TaxID=69181 RepID=A0A8S9RRR6_BRACR|nr:hypothetical protein F2Q69_00059493 [Brassica cretica]
MFVPTANPVREPPTIVANTVLSLLALNYPANKLACYVSDDGCSPLTYFSLKETSKFAKIWGPFCKKYNRFILGVNLEVHPRDEPRSSSQK